MTFEPVLTKRDFVRRYAAGEFGNASPTWPSLPRPVHVRRKYHIRNRIAGGPTWYNIPGLFLPERWRTVCRCHAPETLYVSEMAPTEKTLLQGEVRQSERHLDVLLTCVPLPMREALAVDSWSDYGLGASLALRTCLCPSSWEWLNVLLDRYPEHVVEFSTYAVNWGTIPGYNTVFWEVRRY